jgi:hypothetical protein
MTVSRPNITCQLRPKAVEDLAGLSLDKRKAALKALRILGSLDMVGLRQHVGLNWEPLEGLKDKVTGQQLWSFRFGIGARALCILEANSLIIVATFEPDHTKAYRR